MSILLRSLNHSSLFVLLLTTAACSSDTDSSSPNTDPNSSSSSGHTSIPGSSTAPTTTSSATSAPTSTGTSGTSTGTSSQTSDSTSSQPTSVPDGSDITDDGGAPTDGGAPDDGGTSDPWAGCPSVTVPANAGWPLTLRASEDATYCALFNENRTLKEELAAKVQLRFAPGEHRIPETDTDSLVLPICVRAAAGATAVQGGIVRVSRDEFDGATNYSVRATQTFGNAEPRRLQLALEQAFTADAEITFELNGKDDPSGEVYQSMDLCEVEGEDCFPSVVFKSCTFDEAELHTHDVEFEGGEVTFELRLGDSFAGTEPGAFVEARGTFQGEEFIQKDYFKLIYHPTHHHFERAFVVLFDEPKGDVCGIEVSGLESFDEDATPDQAFTVDCELNHLEEVAVKSHTLVRTTPE